GAHGLAGARKERDVAQPVGKGGDLAAGDGLESLRIHGPAVVLQGASDRSAVVVGQVEAVVLLGSDLEAFAPQRVAHGGEVQGLAVHDHSVEIEDRGSHGGGGIISGNPGLSLGMQRNRIVAGFAALALLALRAAAQEDAREYKIDHRGSLQDVIEKGDLRWQMALGDLRGKKHLFALGVVAKAGGEIMVWNSVPLVTTVPTGQAN